MQFTPINIENWPRRELFWYFSKMAPTGYSLTVNSDITALYNQVKSAKIKFFPVYLWLVTKCLNEQTEFKISSKDDILGYYDTLTPLYASFHDDDKTFSLMWTEFNSDFKVFYDNYIENIKQYGSKHGVLCQPGTPPPNSYTVSCVPWISFEHFAVHSYDSKPYYFPSIEAGKFFEDNDKVYMPLSITCHHATTDGWHVNKFLKRLQYEMDNFCV